MDDENQARTPVAIETEEYEDLGEFELEDAQDFKSQQESEKKRMLSTDDGELHSQRKFSYKATIKSTSLRPIKPKNQSKEKRIVRENIKDLGRNLLQFWHQGHC